MHTNHIITRWDAALPGSWIMVLVNEEFVTRTSETTILCPLSTWSPEEMYGWTVKMSMPSVLAVAMVFFMIPGGVLSDMRGTQGLEAQQLAQGSTHLHRRLKRGWIWKQLFVPEEDPTPRVIGQVLLHIECLPCPWYGTSLWKCMLSSYLGKICKIKKNNFNIPSFSFCSSNLILIKVSLPSSTYYQEKVLEMCLK